MSPETQTSDRIGLFGFGFSVGACLAWAVSASLSSYVGRIGQECLLVLAILSAPMSVLGVALSSRALVGSRTKGDRDKLYQLGMILGMVSMILTFPAFGYVVLHYWVALHGG